MEIKFGYEVRDKDTAKVADCNVPTIIHNTT